VEPSVDGLIADVMASDPDPDVRGQAVFAASLRAFDAFAAAFERSLADPDPRVRRAIVQVAGAHLELAPARRMLERTAQLDPDPDLRAEAARLLSGGNGTL
jgi:HEAT repeat protein